MKAEVGFSAQKPATVLYTTLKAEIAIYNICRTDALLVKRPTPTNPHAIRNGPASKARDRCLSDCFVRMRRIVLRRSGTCDSS
jgi:hypothetical protein